MTDTSLPEADRVDGAPHPRETAHLFGQGGAERVFLDAYTSGRLHHGWLITGPKGIGKATLAWRIARFLLTRSAPGADGLFGGPSPDSLDTDPDHPVARRLLALSESRAFVLRPVWDEDRKRFKQGITVDEVRKLRGFFQLSAPDDGWRVVIVDPADELNPNAANALLKLLEEPPARAVVLLVAHQPSRLLPTIRSRCRTLPCAVLGPDDMAAALAGAGFADAADPGPLAELAGGSVGQAIRLIGAGGPALYADLVALMSGLPQFDRPAAIAFAEKAAGRGQTGAFTLVAGLLDIFLARLARAGATGQVPPEIAAGEAALIARLAPGADSGRHWADLQQVLSARARQGYAVNLDPAALILDTLIRINDAAHAPAA